MLRCLCTNVHTLNTGVEVMTKKIWQTTMFTLAQEKGFSIEKLAELGNYTYTPNYLYKIRSGTRPIPDSLSFQEWVARILDVPREQIFF